MNFLELCRDAARESGTLAGGAATLTTVSGASSGRADKIINWVRQAWISLQLEHDDWFFMQREFEHAIEPGKARYTAAELGVDRLGSWIISDPIDYPFTIWDADTGKADESGIHAIDFPTWRARYDRGVHDRARPTDLAISPQLQVCLGATPDKAYVLRGMYVASPQVLAADTDVPEMPPQYHRAITWEAVKLMAIADEAPSALQTSVGEYSRVRDALTRDQRPRARIGFGSDAVIA